MRESTGSRRGIRTTLPVSDFPDRLNPVFVRELRRLLRSPHFVTGFLLLQIFALLAALLKIGLAVAGPTPPPDALAGVASFFFGFILPLFHFNSLQTELGTRRNGELLATAGLDAWQIVGGRVLAAASLGFVLLVSLLPYFLLVCLVGGSEPLSLLRSMAELLLSHAAMCAIVIGASAFSGVAGRILLVAILGFLFAVHRFPYRIGSGGLLSLPAPGLGWLGETLAAILFLVIGIQIGLSKFQKLERPNAIDDSGPVIVFALVVLPFAHAFAYGLGGTLAGLIALMILTGGFYQLEPIPRRKNQLKPAAPKPPFSIP